MERRRYKIATGKIADKEVDFVIKGNDGLIRYVQVAVTVGSREKLEQEMAAFHDVRDSYPKYILTLDDVYVADHGGVKTMNVIDWISRRIDF